MKKLFVAIVIVFFSFYSLTNFQRLKTQAVLNLLYAETPWYYISILELNKYFSRYNETKPVVISPITPFLIDFYSNGNYDLLPLSKDQEFRSYKKEAWGDNDYSNLDNLYRKLLNDKRELYVSTYGMGNEEGLHQAFANLMEKFQLTQVFSGCFEQCRIYKIELTNNNASDY